MNKEIKLTFKFLLIGFILLFCLAKCTYANNSYSEINCMTAMIFFEARGEPYAGQAAVAQVTFNRLNHPNFPDSICKIISQKSQFSWYNKDSRITNVLKGRIHDLKAKDREMYLQAKDIASKAVLGLIEYNPKLEGALYFVHKSVSSKQQPWLRKMKLKARIGNHRFYGEN